MGLRPFDTKAHWFELNAMALGLQKFSLERKNSIEHFLNQRVNPYGAGATSVVII